MASSFLNAAGTAGRVTINERLEAAAARRRILARVSRAVQRLEQGAQDIRTAVGVSDDLGRDAVVSV